MLNQYSHFLNHTEIQKLLLPESFLELQHLAQQKNLSIQETVRILCEEQRQIEKTQQRLLLLEEALDSVLQFIDLNDLYELRGHTPSPELDALKKTFDGVISSFYEKDHDIRQLLVNVVKLSIQYWQQSGAGTKIHLAEKSRLWKVYLDRGSYQTRTLDKYLTLESLPKRPNWKRVLRTANYVLQHCEAPSPNRTQLEESVSSLVMLVKRK